MTHLLTTPKFDLLLYIGEKCAKNPYFYHFFWKKEVKLGKNKKKSCCGHQLRTMTYFSKYHTFNPLLYLGCQMLRTHFFFTFSGKNRSNNKIFGKKNLWASTRSHDPFFDKPKIWPTFIYLYHQFFKSSCACSNSWPTKKNLQASTRTHDTFFDNPEIWPTFIYRGEVPPDTFAKLPVCALINDPKKLFQKKGVCYHSPMIWSISKYVQPSIRPK